MDITPQLSESAPLISRYGSSGFVIGGVRYESSVLIDAAGTVHTASGCSPEALACALQAEILPELILFGMGAGAQLLPPEMRQMLDTQQIGYEMMDTGAACRSFNVLLAEDRRVAALLMAV